MLFPIDIRIVVLNGATSDMTFPIFVLCKPCWGRAAWKTSVNVRIARKQFVFRFRTYPPCFLFCLKPVDSYNPNSDSAIEFSCPGADNPQRHNWDAQVSIEVRSH
jgi:hypothetical protein